jgi:FixH protein
MTLSTETPSNAGRLWAWVPAMLLGTMLLGLGTLAYIAIDDPHFALEANYYDKAVHWDTARTEARENEVLGLKVVLGAPLVVAADGKLNVAIGVQTRQDLALSGAVVELEAFPNAYASRVQRISLRETAPGAYAGELSQAVRGLWELRVVVKRGSLRYSQVLRLDVTKAGAA